MIRLTLDYSEFKDAAKSFAEAIPQIEEQLWTEVLDVSKQTETRIKEEMPVDTGRAKASWGHFTPGDLRPGKIRRGRPPKNKKLVTPRTSFLTAPSQWAERFAGTGQYNEEGRQVASAGEAIWEEDRANLMVTQGTEVPYVPFLNEGHSTQATKGFIDTAEEWATRQLEKVGSKLEQVLDRVIRQSGRYKR